MKQTVISCGQEVGFWKWACGAQVPVRIRSTACSFKSFVTSISVPDSSSSSFFKPQFTMAYSSLDKLCFIEECCETTRPSHPFFEPFIFQCKEVLLSDRPKIFELQQFVESRKLTAPQYFVSCLFYWWGVLSCFFEYVKKLVTYLRCHSEGRILGFQISDMRISICYGGRQSMIRYGCLRAFRNNELSVRKR